MSVLSRRGPYANQPAKLPALQAVRSNASLSELAAAVESLRQWVEVRLGARGDKFERAVTERDLNPRLDTLRAEVMARVTAIEDAMALADSRDVTAAPAPAPAGGGIPASVTARLNDMEAAIATLQQQLAVALARLDEIPEKAESLTLLPAALPVVPQQLLAAGPTL